MQHHQWFSGHRSVGEGITSTVRPHSAFDIRPVPHRVDRLVPVGSHKRIEKKKGSTGTSNKKKMFTRMREILLADLLKDLARGLPSDSFESE